MNIYNISELVATLVENLLIIIFYIKFFSIKKRTITNYTLSIITYIVICTICLVSTYLGTTDDYGVIVAMLAMIIFGYFCLNGSIVKKSIFSICVFISIAVVNIFTLQILGILFNVPISYLTDAKGEYRIIVLFVTKLSFYVVGKVTLILTKKQEFQLTRKEWLTCILVTASTWLMFVMIFKNMHIANISQYTKYLIIFFSILLILVDIIIYGMVLKLSRSNREEMRHRLMRNQIEQQKKMMTHISESNEKIRHLKHDMKNYLVTTMCLIDNQEYKTAKTYMTELVGNIEEIKSLIILKNATLSSLLNMKLDVCNKENIKWQAEIKSELSGISDVDISIIIGNLMDNAIEASRKVKTNPMIEIKIFDIDNQICIIMKNVIEKSVLSSNPNLFTTKKDKNSHGIGLMNVKEIVRKYHGFYENVEENNLFITKILLEQNIK